MKILILFFFWAGLCSIIQRAHQFLNGRLRFHVYRLRTSCHRITLHFDISFFPARFFSLSSSCLDKYTRLARNIIRSRVFRWRPTHLRIFIRFLAIIFRNHPFYYTWNDHRIFFLFQSAHLFRVFYC